MRLLYRDKDGAFQLTNYTALRGLLPKYAILSHTWLVDNEQEVTYKDLMSGGAENKLAGYHKIRFCAEQAAQDGLDYFWVDTCCIDKDSSAELQEAIVSMFTWYQNATKCYTYLPDVSTTQGPWESAFRRSRWFTRGWTLQELLAPASVEFFSVEGERLGDKKSLEHHIHDITEIPLRALQGHDLAEFSIAERLSWSKNRHTSRKEDKAYCLLGIFNVFLPLIYGEGDYAYTRLREELDKRYAENAKLDQLLSTLPIATEASFNSLSNQHEPMCLPNTRTELLGDIAEWADGRDERCILWLNGIAGTGKSTVARTVSRICHDRGNLGASFFFSRGGGEVSNADKVITTLARQLAAKIPSVKRFIYEAIMEHSDVANHSFRDQWNQLILGPLSRLNANFSPSTLVFVIDALDECDSERDIRSILAAFASARSLHSPRLRILLTSRPEIAIRHSVGKMPELVRQVFTLHEIAPDVVDKDLGRFFESNFSAIREERGFEDDWPGIQNIKRLVEISCGLFIWASTACRFIREGRRLATRRVELLIHKHRSDAGPEKQLDQIYTTILQDSLRQGYNDDEKAELYEILREVLGSLVVLASPLPMESLARLLNKPPRHLDGTLADLHTIFHIPRQASRPIRLHHPTFRDFLLDKQRCIDLDFWVDAKQAHRILAESCLSVMERYLKRDICGLQSPGTPVQDVDADLIERCIPTELQYACLYWVHHCRQSEMVFADGDRVHRFFQEHYLHWLEAINLMGKSAEMGGIIRLYHSLLVPSKNTRQLTLVKDARRFIFAFQSIIKQAPLQTYCAALAFIAPSNELRAHFRSQMHPWIKDIRIAKGIVGKKKDEFNYVNDLAWTPDGRRIASGSNTAVVRFWHVPTKAALRKFEGATDKISSVAISPDGRTIAAGSDDFTVMVWHLETGDVFHVLEAHSGWVNSVFFSPDGRMLASGSMDQTVALWDAATGKALGRVDNQSSGVNSATFSPDGKLMVTGSVDQMVRVWDVSRDSAELRVELVGHEGCVNSVRFSADGKRLVSGSDDMTVRLWDIDTGTDIRKFKGHTKKVMAVAITSGWDARQVVSGSEDWAVKVWDTTNGALLHTLTGHTSGINAVVFSPDHRLLASGSFDDEVRLWDTKNWAPRGTLGDFDDDDGHDDDDAALSESSGEEWQMVVTAISGPAVGLASKAHAGTVTSVVFSPDGRLLASGSKDGTAKLWSREGGEKAKLVGHEGGICHLAFSPDSRLIASASNDRTARIWDTGTGATLHTLRDHSDGLSLVRFSPDGRLLASCSADKTVRLWDVTTGAALGTAEAHTDVVTHIAFSPDSRYLASCSADSTILLWDLETKAASAARLRGHLGRVNSVAFSVGDGQLLVSSSDDTTVRLWSRSTGSQCGIIKGDSVPVYSATVSPDQRLVASCAADGTVSLWDRVAKRGHRAVHVGAVLRRVGFSECGRYLATDRGVIEVASLFPTVELVSGSRWTNNLRADQHVLFVAKEWVTKKAENGVWLPEEYHATSVATREGLAVMGHASGALSFLAFS
ncbi:hypothetical protein C8A05DRAFT_18255 [Staphylotrichum tortipilum]|uniref:Vegetative incompatibility protein HET-E-1 n=1 Tax=Staphylotrichum tortipilum TaxID=2831512 RepID=A0AAN6RR09_9PEZI|nr:hypothetical protein C8A05DRAFT_18255 [Staphylotrichum longicolle]